MTIEVVDVVPVVEGAELEVIPPDEVRGFTPARTLGAIPHLGDFIMLAERIANTGMVPTALRRKPDEVLAVVLYGAELGLGPMQSLNQINFINGKPSMAAEMMRALIQNAGHEIIVTSDATLATARVHRSSWAADHWEEVAFSIDDAKQAGLRGDNWSKYPDQMLTARVTSKAGRMHFADVLLGMSYTPEEVESFSPTPATPATPPAPTVRPSPIARPDDGEAISPEQLTKIKTVMGKLHMDRDAGLQFAVQVIKREIASSKDMTKREASTVIEALERVESQDPGPQDEPL